MACQPVKDACCLVALTLALSGELHACPSKSVTRDEALRGVEACIQRNWAPSRECKNLNKNIATLEDAYRQGDKAVLPTLLHFTGLTEFYGDALVADPDGFLTAVSHLSEAQQRAVAAGIAGGMFGLPRVRFDTARAALKEVPESSPNYQLARKCLETLETENACWIVHYFPPQTFKGRASDLRLHWFSRELYVLGEKPLWPPETANERMYRVIVLPSFLPSECVTLTVMPDGTGQMEFRAADAHDHRLGADDRRTISPQQVASFAAALDRARFWELPTGPPPSRIVVMDGAEWILEVVQDRKYHIVHRTCPGRTPFGGAALDLFDLSGHTSKGRC
jgi:hypothetical protein